MSEAEQLSLTGTPTTKAPDEQPKTDAPKDDVRTIMKEFSFQLNNDDLAKKATQLGELSAELDAATARLDSAKGAFKSAEAQIKAAQRDIIDAVRTRKEMRTVWCEEVKDFEHGRVYWRPKNGEGILGERPMTNDERQIQMNLDEKKEAEAKPGAEYEQAAKAETEIKTATEWDALKDAPPGA